MSFTTEFLLAEDPLKYRLHEISSRFVVEGTEYTHVTTWSFCWRGILVIAEIENVGIRKSESDGSVHELKRLTSLKLPRDLEHDHVEVISDLIEALTACRTGAGYALPGPYALTLEI